MRVPVILLGESFIDAVVEVLVVGEDDVAADIVKLRRRTVPGSSQLSALVLWDVVVVLPRIGAGLTKPSGVTSVEARPPALVLESTISHEGPS